MKRFLVVSGVGVALLTTWSAFATARQEVTPFPQDPQTVQRREETRSLYEKVVRGDGDLSNSVVKDAAARLIDMISTDGYEGSATSFAMGLCKYPAFKQKVEDELPALFASYNLHHQVSAATIVQVMKIKGFEKEIAATLESLKRSDDALDLQQAGFISERLAKG